MTPRWIDESFVAPIGMKSVIAVWPWMGAGIEPAFVFTHDAFGRQEDLLLVALVSRISHLLSKISEGLLHGGLLATSRMDKTHMIQTSMLRYVEVC